MYTWAYSLLQIFILKMLKFILEKTIFYRRRLRSKCLIMRGKRQQEFMYLLIFHYFVFVPCLYAAVRFDSRLPTWFLESKMVVLKYSRVSKEPNPSLTLISDAKLCLRIVLGNNERAHTSQLLLTCFSMFSFVYICTFTLEFQKLYSSSHPPHSVSSSSSSISILLKE